MIPHPVFLKPTENGIVRCHCKIKCHRGQFFSFVALFRQSGSKARLTWDLEGWKRAQKQDGLDRMREGSVVVLMLGTIIVWI